MNFKYFSNYAQPAKTFPALFIMLCIYIVFRSLCQDLTGELPSHLQKYILKEDTKNMVYTGDIDELKLVLEEINSKQNISNLEKFRPVEDGTPILVIQVHEDIKRLQYLILSLSQVQGIQTALLIFSHSYYHESLNRLIHSIDFCKVMQIFYPFSLQLHPYKYPGVDPDDCEPGYPGNRSTKYCAIRDARLTEHKQHWWWKANFLFRRTKWSKRHKTPVIFLEEDNYVMPDLLHMYQYIHRSLEYFPFVEIMSLGRPWIRSVDIDLLTVESWKPPFDVGLAFNKTIWKKILELSAQFCMYNDYSWSYSLLHLFKNFPRGHVDMVGCMVPRVLSTKEFENNDFILKKISGLVFSLEFFPKKVQTVYLFGPAGRVERVFKGPPVGNGGWNDLRDQLLCLDPLLSTTTEEKRYDNADITRS